MFGFIIGYLIGAHALRKPNDCLISQVSELIDPVTKCWDIDILNAMFSQEVVDSIFCIPLSSRWPKDRITWKLEKKVKKKPGSASQN